MATALASACDTRSLAAFFYSRFFTGGVLAQVSSAESGLTNYGLAQPIFIAFLPLLMQGLLFFACLLLAIYS